MRLARLEEQLAARARDAELEKAALGAKYGGVLGGGGVSRGSRCCPVSRRRLAELAAALERLRAEDGEKERAVEALTLQLQNLVSAGCDEFRGGMRAESGGARMHAGAGCLLSHGA